MRGTERWRWLVAVLAIVALVGAACGDEGGDTTDTGDNGDTGAETTEFEAGTTMADLQDKGEITIGVKFDVPGFGFKNPQSGEVEGFDVDLGTRIAEELGVEPKFIEAISDNRIPFLADGTVDLILSTMTITTDRDAEIDFSRPYYIAHGRILVPGDSDITGIDDTAGKKICTALGSTYETVVLPEQAPEADAKIVDTYSECFALLQRGQVDGMITDDVILSGFLQQDKTMQIVGDPLTTDPYGAGIAEGDTEFADFVSGVIDETLEDGTWMGWYDNWIGQYTGQPAEDPAEFTLEDAYEIYPCVETC